MAKNALIARSMPNNAVRLINAKRVLLLFLARWYEKKCCIPLLRPNMKTVVAMAIIAYSSDIEPTIFTGSRWARKK